MRTIGVAVLTVSCGVGMSAQGTDVLVRSSQHPQTETSIAIDPNNPGRLFLAANGRLESNPVRTEVCWFFSSDTGRTWQGGEDSPNGVRLGGDHVAFFDRNGNAYLAAMDRNNA
jgi:hypothetical protein